MGKRFLLFGEKPFEDYAVRRFSEVKESLSRLSEVELLMYRDTFDELVAKTVEAYAFPALDISFENQVVDLVNHAAHNGPRYFAEYTVTLTGDPYYLGLAPTETKTRFLPLPVEVRKNFFSFEIDTGSAREELNKTCIAEVRTEYDKIRKFISASLKDLNGTIAFFNKELERFVIPILATRLRRAEKSVKVRESLNFKV